MTHRLDVNDRHLPSRVVEGVVPLFAGIVFVGIARPHRQSARFQPASPSRSCLGTVTQIDGEWTNLLLLRRLFALITGASPPLSFVLLSVLIPGPSQLNDLWLFRILCVFIRYLLKRLLAVQLHGRPLQFGA